MPKSKINNCQNYQSQLSAYFDNELPTWKRHIIRWHLKRCANCTDRYATIQQTDKLLNYLEPVNTSEYFLSNVMSRVKTMQTYENAQRSVINRIGSAVENMKSWIRGNIRAYNPLYMTGFVFGVVMMVGVTLYSPKIEKLNPFNQSNAEASEVNDEKLISFEVIPQDQPKRFLKIR